MTTQAAMDATSAEGQGDKDEAATPQIEPMGDLLEQFSLYFDLQLASSQIASVVGDVNHEADKPWNWRLMNAAESIGLSAVHLELEPSAARESARRSEGVLVTRLHDAWLALRFARRGKTRALILEDMGRRRAAGLDSGALMAMVGDEPRPWIVVEPRLSMQGLSMGGLAGSTPDKIPPPRKAIKRLKALLAMEREAVMAVIVYAVLVGILGLLTPIAVQALVNTVAFGVVLQPLVMLAIVVLVGLTFLGILRVMEHWVVEFIQRRIFVRLVTDLSHRLPRVDVEAHERKYTPELLNRFFDVVTVNKAVSTLLLDTLGLTLQLVIGLLVLAFYHPYLLAFDVLLMLAIGFVLFALGRGAVETSIKESDAKYAAAAWLEEIARHPMSFKSRRGAKIAAEQAERLSIDWIGARSSHFRILMRQIIGAVIVQALASAGLLGLGGWLVLNGQLTLGQLVAAELIVTTVAANIAKLGKHLETYYDMAAGVYKVGMLLDLPLEREVGEVPHQKTEAAELDLDGVCLSRGSSNLSNLELHIKPGERVGIVGCDGAGTSTLLEAIYGMRECNKGMIRMDGVPVRDLSPPALRDEVSLVREWDVFEGTIEENVRLGQRELSPRRVRAALEAVGLLEEFDRLPEGLQTRLIAHGAPLSPDQLNRLMLARAILSEPRLMMIDRALDGVRPERLEDTLEALVGPNATWSVLIVSHRPEVLARCDRVLELEAGGFVEVDPAQREADGQA